MIFFKLGGKRFSDNLFNLLVHLNSWLARLWMALFFRWVGLTQRGPLLVSPRLKYFHWLDWEIFSWQIIITFAASPQTRPCDNYSWRGLRSGWDSSGWKWMEIIDMYNYMYNIYVHYTRGHMYNDESNQWLTWSARQKPLEWRSLSCCRTGTDSPDCSDPWGIFHSMLNYFMNVIIWFIFLPEESSVYTGDLVLGEKSEIIGRHQHQI